MTPLLQLSMQIQCTTWKISEIKDTSNRERHLGHHRKGQLRKGLKVLTCRFIGSKIRDTLKAHESSECCVWNPIGFHSSMKNIQSWLCKWAESRFIALPITYKYKKYMLRLRPVGTQLLRSSCLNYLRMVCLKTWDTSNLMNMQDIFLSKTPSTLVFTLQAKALQQWHLFVLVRYQLLTPGDRLMQWYSYAAPWGGSSKRY